MPAGSEKSSIMNNGGFYKKIRASLVSVSVMALFFALGILIAYGKWYLITTQPPDPNTSPPLSTGYSEGKGGGLILNADAQPADAGLIVSDSGDLKKGFVFLRDVADQYGYGIPLALPREKLDLVGNLKISGLIAPYNNRGSSGQIFMNDGSRDSWQNRRAFLTLVGSPGTCWFPLYPSTCADVGYVEYGKYCIPDYQNSGYDLPVRLCYKSF